MKSITKLRLINWHYFSNITADIKNITFLTGPNGTGKSTIIDALQIIILGTTRPDNFNKAANEKGRSGRNLISYLRGQTGIKDDGSAFVLRDGTFTSYIAIELYDDVNNKYFTLGACFDVDASDKIDKHYFYLDSPFPENGFTNCDFEPNKAKVRGMMYKELAAFVRGEYKPGHFKFFDTDVEYQTFAKEAFGNLPDKYFQLFKKAVSFAPISNISSFITEYICDADKNVDIGPMQKNIEQYKILESEAKNLKIKVAELEKIQAAYDEVAANLRKGELLNYVNSRVVYDENERNLSAYQEKLDKAETQATYISDSIARFDAQLEDLQSDLESYNAKKLQSDSYSLTEKLAMKKDGLIQKVSTIQRQVSNVTSTISTYAQSYVAACSEFVNYFKDFRSSPLGDEKISKAFDDLYQLCADVTEEGSEILVDLPNNKVDFESVKNFRDDMEALKSSAQSFRSILQARLYEVSGELTSLQNDIQAVNSGKKPFDKLGPAYMEIKRELETALKARHSDADIEIYCDLIDVVDPQWTMALEAVLYGQKFNFFVNAKYYEDANRILKELCANYNYYHVSLVDTEKLLNANIYANEDSVAKLIVTDNPGARCYTDFLLGRIKKCKTFQEARDSGSGLLSDCTGYRNFATWYLNKATAKVFFLGTKVSDNTKALSSSDYQRVNKTFSLLNEVTNKLENILYLQVMSNAEFSSYETDFKKLDEISYIQSQIDQVDKDILEASNGDMAHVMEKVDALNYSIKTIQNQRTEALTQKGVLQAEIERLKSENIPNAQLQIKESAKTLETYDKDKVNEEFEPFYNRLIDEQHLSLRDIKAQSYRELVQAQSKATRDKANLTRFRNDYCSRYNLNYDVQNDKSNDEFAKDYENISKVMLPDYEEKIAKAHEDSIKEFKDDFIYKLRTAIESVMAQIDELNKALEDARFGRDSYQFKVFPNKDYIQYYNMIMDPLLYVSGDAENLFMEKYKTTMDDLFNLISSSTNATGEQKEQILRNVELFTTYTTYIVFDLLVTSGTVEGSRQTISLAKSFTSKSGGETQTPFYISILASFAQLCRVNSTADNNTLRLVIFDEAFSKMDAARIVKSTDLLRQFGLQAILSTPSEKLRDLIGCVDQVLVTMHDDKKKRSYVDIYRDKDKDSEEDLSAGVKKSNLGDSIKTDKNGQGILDFDAKLNDDTDKKEEKTEDGNVLPTLNDKKDTEGISIDKEENAQVDVKVEETNASENSQE